MNSLPSQSRAVGVDAIGIRLAAVIGAGSMGGGIAAQFANAGVPVILLDVAGADASLRNAAALAGIDRQLKTGGFMDAEAARLVRAGNVEDDIGLLAEADWIVEAVIEDLEAKRALYRRIAAIRKQGAIVSSNTSTIPRAALAGGMDEELASHFLITHFFNPPRVMSLVEIVAAEENAPETIARVKAACETVLGKTVVDCFDTPGFIANRIGCYWLAAAALEAKRAGLTIEEADAVNTAFGVPRTGAFGLLDLIGIDLIPHVWGSLMRTLPSTDALQAHDLPGDGVVRDLMAAGRFGRKAGAGFYLRGEGGAREAMDLSVGEYRLEAPVKQTALPGGGRDLAALLEAEGPLGAYAWTVFSSVLLYTAGHAPEIAADVAAIDTAMELGYAWKRGPFRLADAYGAARAVARLEADGRPAPDLLRAAAAAGGFYDMQGRPLASSGERLAAPAAGGLALAAVRTGSSPIFTNEAASVWNLGDGVACLELHTKMNSFAPAVFDVLEMAVEQGSNAFRALVLGNDDPRAFSVGADLGFFAEMIGSEQWQAIDTYLARGQELFLRLKYAPFPVVAAAHGFALGGGCEFMLHADAIVAHAELKAGLPEVKVGLVPAWGGCTQLLVRAQASCDDPSAAAQRVFDTIFAGVPTGSALEARALGLLRPSDGIVMNRAHLIAAAKARAAALAEAGYEAPARATIAIGGPDVRAVLTGAVEQGRAAGRMTDTDVAMAEILAWVLTGGAETRPQATEEELMRLEREALTRLVRTPATLARIDHMLKTGKPLRN